MMELKSLREKAGYTQENAAEQLGVSTSTVQNWEKDGAACPPEKLNRVLDLYQVWGKEREEIVLSLYNKPYQDPEEEAEVDNFPYFLIDRDSLTARKAVACRFSAEEMEIFGYMYYLGQVDKANSGDRNYSGLDGSPAKWPLDYRFLCDHGGVLRTLAKISEIKRRFPYAEEMQEAVYDYGLSHPEEGYSFCSMPPAYIAEHLHLFSSNADIGRLYQLCRAVRTPVFLGTTEESHMDRVPELLKEFTTWSDGVCYFYQEKFDKYDYGETVMTKEAPAWTCSCVELVKEESTDPVYLAIKSKYESDLAAYNAHPGLYTRTPSFQENFTYTVRLTEKGKQLLTWCEEIGFR